ncbi:MAG: transketolase family protein [Oscillospiraceae bacterium]|nr:transketolase family protein [Oscillospiraceae bacterium]
MPKALREIYGEVLRDVGRENKDIVVLDADLSGSTKSAIFGKEFPERFFNMGIAEANMVSTAAGLAAGGKIPFVNTFTVFLTTIGLIATRGLVCYGNLNVKFGGAYGGVSAAYDGASHHALEDIANMRALPNMLVICTCDENSTRQATEFAVKHNGPVYLRLSRETFPDLYQAGESAFEFGKAKIVRDGTDCTIMGCGIMVHHALQAADILAGKGISARVVDMSTIKPIDRDMIERCIVETGAIVSAEEHNIIGGLGSAIAEAMATMDVHAPMEFVGTEDTFTESGKYADLLKKYKLDPETIAAKAEKAVSRKK